MTFNPEWLAYLDTLSSEVGKMDGGRVMYRLSRDPDGALVRIEVWEKAPNGSYPYLTIGPYGAPPVYLEMPDA